MRFHLLFALVAIASLLAAGVSHAQKPLRAVPSARADTAASPVSARAALLRPLSYSPAPPHSRSPKDLTLLEPAPSFHPRRFWYGVGSAAALDVGFTAALASIWYDESERTGFHFYSESENIAGTAADDGWLDDWHAFAQVDKFGHVWTSWHIARIVGRYGRWAGLPPREAGLFGGAVSTIFQMQIEVSDGFSEAYGFSRTDALSNLIGSTVGGLKVAYPERLGWLGAKYSYRPSPYYGTRTTGVGGGGVGGYLGNAIKDYDGATYWLTVRPKELLQGRARQVWPDWLAFSAGYGGDGLAHAVSGLSYPDSPEGESYEHRREFYIGPDIDLLHSLDLPQPFQAVLRFFQFVRLPAPALQLAPEVQWHWAFY
jgi:hypothetical protein